MSSQCREVTRTLDLDLGSCLSPPNLLAVCLRKSSNLPQFISASSSVRGQWPRVLAGLTERMCARPSGKASECQPSLSSLIDQHMLGPAFNPWRGLLFLPQITKYKHLYFKSERGWELRCTWDIFHREVFESHLASEALKILWGRSTFQVRTWENERWPPSTPGCSQETNTCFWWPQLCSWCNHLWVWPGCVGRRVKGQSLSQTVWALGPAQLFIYRVTLDKLPHLAVLQFPHLSNEDNNSSYPSGGDRNKWMNTCQQIMTGLGTQDAISTC